MQSWLNEYADSGLELTGERTFCFDSEASRYLVANRQGYDLGGRSDMEYSWEHSSTEMRRMIDYFASARPHQLAETAEHAYTRRILPILANQLSESEMMIRTTIALLEDQNQGVVDQQRIIRSLQQKLKVQRILLQSKPLDKPRTVCKHLDCVEYVDDGSGDGTIIPNYKSHCHEPCYDIGPVQLDCVGHPGLLDCAAFKQGESCIKCGHHWSEHLHVLYEIVGIPTEVVDTEVERMLVLANDQLQVQEEAVGQQEHRNKVYQEELIFMKTVESQSRIFLRRNSFMTGRMENTQVRKVLPKYPSSMTFTSSMTPLSSRTSQDVYMDPVGRNWGNTESEIKVKMLVVSLSKLKETGPCLSDKLQEDNMTPNSVYEKVRDIR